MDHEFTANDLQLPDIKHAIRKMLITTRKMTEEELLSKFRVEAGCKIPYGKFGHSSLNSFLKSIPDVVRVDGNIVHSVEVPVIAHMDKIILKVPPKLTNNCKIPAICKKKVPPIYYKGSSYADPPSNDEQTAPSSPESLIVPTAVQFMLYRVLAKHPQGISLDDVNTLINCKYPLKVFDIKGGAQQLVELLPHLAKISDGLVFLAEEDKQRNKGVLHGGELMFNNPIIDTKTITNFRKILDEFPDGVWASDLPTIYNERFGVPLKCQVYGYTTMAQLAKELPEVFHVIRPDFFDYLLMDARKDLLPCYARHHIFSSDDDQLVDFPETLDDLEVIRKETLNLKRQLHGGYFSVYEPWVLNHIIGSYREIPQPTIPISIEKLEYLEVCVGDIIDPSNFWVQIHDPDRKSDLNVLQDDLKHFYTRNKYKIPRAAIKPDQICTFRCKTEWRRARILKAPVENETEVFFIDYGTKGKVKIPNLRFLVEKFAVLPAQAIKCSLVNIKPAKGQDKWTPAACERFQKLVMEQPKDDPFFPIEKFVSGPKRLLGIFTSVSPLVRRFSCALVDTSSEEDLHINDTLVFEGHAEFVR